MAIKVELTPEIEARLKAEAQVQGVSLEEAVEQLLRAALAGQATIGERMSVEQFHAMLTEMAKGSESLPELPTESFSRESFYEERLNGRDAVPR